MVKNRKIGNREISKKKKIGKFRKNGFRKKRKILKKLQNIKVEERIQNLVQRMRLTSALMGEPVAVGDLKASFTKVAHLYM